MRKMGTNKGGMKGGERPVGVGLEEDKTGQDGAGMSTQSRRRQASDVTHSSRLTSRGGTAPSQPSEESGEVSHSLRLLSEHLLKLCFDFLCLYLVVFFFLESNPTCACSPGPA